MVVTNPVVSHAGFSFVLIVKVRLTLLAFGVSNLCAVAGLVVNYKQVWTCSPLESPYLSQGSGQVQHSGGGVCSQPVAGQVVVWTHSLICYVAIPVPPVFFTSPMPALLAVVKIEVVLSFISGVGQYLCVA